MLFSIYIQSITTQKLHERHFEKFLITLVFTEIKSIKNYIQTYI